MDRRQLLSFAPLVAAGLWGGMYVVSKWGFETVPPLTLAFLRVALGGLILWLIVGRISPDRQFSRAEWRGFLVLATWLTAALTTQFVGTDLTNASQGALLTVLTPVFVLALGVVALDERLTRPKAAGTALAAVGTFLVVGDQYDLAAMTAGSVGGVVLLVFSSYCFAAFTVYGKPLIRRYSALEAVTYGTVVSIPMFAGFALAEVVLLDIPLSSVRSWAMTPGIVGAVLYLGALSTAAAWYCWYKGMEYTDAGTTAVFFFAQPVVGSALGALFLGESLGVAFVVGGVVMAAGIYVVSSSTAASV